MRKVVCQACKNRYGDSGCWVIFRSCVICESCRLATIAWFKESDEFDLGHPFVVELMLIQKK
jgi:hypothetical protein